MRIHHQTGRATLLQFIVGTVLAFITGATSIVGGCASAANGDCVSNTFVSLTLVLLTVGAYGVLATVGFVAQARRSSRLALLLIGLEAAAGIVFLFDTKQSPDIIDRLANLAGLAVAIWVAYIAFNLFRSRGARVVKHHIRDS